MFGTNRQASTRQTDNKWYPNKHSRHDQAKIISRFHNFGKCSCGEMTDCVFCPKAYLIISIKDEEVWNMMLLGVGTNQKLWVTFYELDWRIWRLVATKIWSRGWSNAANRQTHFETERQPACGPGLFCKEETVIEETAEDKTVQTREKQKVREVWLSLYLQMLKPGRQRSLETAS